MMKDKGKIIIKKLKAGGKPGGSDNENYEWGLEFIPEFHVSDLDFHANISFEMKGYMFPRVDVLELKGESEDELIRLVLSKSLIKEYIHQNDTHTFLLAEDGDVLRLDEMVFVNRQEIPESLKEKLEKQM